MKEEHMRRKSSKLYTVPSNLMGKGWRIRRINENAVEEKLQSQIHRKFHFFLEVL